MRRVSLSFVLGATLALTACGKFEAPEAKRTAPPPEPEAPLSTVSATLSLPAATIAHIINDKTGTKIAEVNDQPVDCKFTQCRVDLIATRNGLAEVHAEEGRVDLTLPFALDARIRAKALFVGLGAKGHGIGTARTSTALALAPNWQLVAHTTGDVHLEQSRIDIGGMRLDLTDTLNKNSAKLSRPLLGYLDKDIPKALKLKPQMEKLWAEAFKPIRVGKKPLAWLLLQPQTIRVAPPDIARDAVNLGLAIEGHARVVVTDTPPEATPTPLPRLEPLRERSNVFRFYVPAALAYDDAAHLAMEALKNKPIRLGGGMTVRVMNLAILPSGEDVVVQTRFCVDPAWWDIFGWFASCGTGYLRGAPTFDAETETIRIAHVHYDVATQGIVLGLARAFEGDALGKELEKRLVFAVGKDIAKLREGVQKSLARPQGRDVTISAEVKDFGAPSLAWTKDGFIAFFSAEGIVHAVVHLR